MRTYDKQTMRTCNDAQSASCMVEPSVSGYIKREKLIINDSHGCTVNNALHVPISLSQCQLFSYFRCLQKLYRLKTTCRRKEEEDLTEIYSLNKFKLQKSSGRWIASRPLGRLYRRSLHTCTAVTNICTLHHTVLN